MSHKANTILLIDNSIAFTGAFKCALQQAEIMSPEYRYVFVLPSNSTNIELLREKGFEVYPLPMSEIRKNVISLINYIPKLLSNSLRLKKIIRDIRPSIVIMNDFYNLLGVLVKNKHSDFRLITYVRLLPEAVPAILRKLWVSSAIQKADIIIAVSDAVKHQLPQYDKIVRVYDPAIFKEKHDPEISFPRSINKIRLLYLANYIRGKGQNFALKAFAKAYAYNNKIELTFVGGDMGLEKNRQFKSELIEEVRALGLDEVIHFHSFSDDVEATIKHSDILINFSEAESFSMTVAEASFYGTPVIASKCGGPEEIIIHGESGLLVENRNIDQMAAAIIQLSSSLAMQQQFSQYGKHIIREKFSSLSFKETMLQLFSRLSN